MFLKTVFLLSYGTIAAAIICNGQAEFCHRRYSNVTHIGTHGSPFTGTVYAHNQDWSPKIQLQKGIRVLQGQVHEFSGLTMCGTNCGIMNKGPLENFFRTVKRFLDKNPHEVVTLLLVNSSGERVKRFARVMRDADITRYAFAPPQGKRLEIDEWPTLKEMIDSKKRLVTFLDWNANTTEIPYILDGFKYFFETPYENLDPLFNQCTLDRPPNGSPDGRMYIMNHFLSRELESGLQVPDIRRILQTNAANGSGSIGAQAELCFEKWGRSPKFVLVDLFNKGDVFTAQDNLNRLEFK